MPGEDLTEAVAQDRGRFAVERGPLVYCAEGVDNGGKVCDAVLPPDVALAPRPITIAATPMTALVGDCSANRDERTWPWIWLERMVKSLKNVKPIHR